MHRRRAVPTRLGLLALSFSLLSSCGGGSGGSDTSGGSGAGCTAASNAHPTFTVSPADLSGITAIQPRGSANSGEIKPHTFFYVTSATANVAVSAPVDSTLDAIAYYTELGLSQWLLVFRASCEVTYKFDHLINVPAAIASAGPAVPGSTTVTSSPTRSVSVRAGDIVGSSRGNLEAGTPNAFDFGVYNTTVTNQFVNQARYVSSHMDTRLHSDCPYDYYQDPLKSQFAAKFGTTAGPVAGASCGSASRDVSGTAAGMWFLDAGTDATYPATFGLAADVNADARISGLAGGTIIVAGGVDPAAVTTAQCWSNGANYAYVSVVNAQQMNVSYGAGVCPGAFPATFKTYSR